MDNFYADIDWQVTAGKHMKVMSKSTLIPIDNGQSSMICAFDDDAGEVLHVCGLMVGLIQNVTVLLHVLLIFKIAGFIVACSKAETRIVYLFTSSARNCLSGQ